MHSCFGEQLELAIPGCLGGDDEYEDVLENHAHQPATQGVSGQASNMNDRDAVGARTLGPMQHPQLVTENEPRAARFYTSANVEMVAARATDDVLDAV